MPMINFTVRAFGMDMAGQEFEREVNLPFPPAPGMILKGLRADRGRVRVRETEWDIDTGHCTCRLDDVGTQYAELNDARNALGSSWREVMR
jgi:hypothetical protein